MCFAYKLGFETPDLDRRHTRLHFHVREFAVHFPYFEEDQGIQSYKIDFVAKG